jgi:hypothetical protein
MALRPPHHLSGLAALRICLENPPTGLDPHFQSGAVPTLLRLPFVDNVAKVVAEY